MADQVQVVVPEHTRIKPILHFTERDIWGNIMVNKIPYCTLYERRYRPLGAVSTSNITAEGVPNASEGGDTWLRRLNNSGRLRLCERRYLR